MRCGFCDLEFDESQAVVTCKSCPLSKSCHLICCPRCGYENPPEPRLVRWFRKRNRKLRENATLLDEL